MARKCRLQYPGAINHVMSRGDRQEPIFDDDVDRERFLETLAGGGNAPGQSGGGNAVVSEHLHRTVPPAIRAPVRSGGVEMRPGEEGTSFMLRAPACGDRWPE